MGRSKPWAALLIAALLGMAAPGGPTRAAERLVFAQSNDTLIWAPLYVARKLGYFADEGIDPDVVIVKSGPAALTAVTSGSAQIAVGFPATPVEAAEKGLPIRIFAELSNQFIAELVLRRDVAERLKLTAATPIAGKVQALRGLTIAMNGVGSANDYLLRQMIAGAGMQPESDVTVTPIAAAPAVLAAMDQRRVDGWVATPPGNAIAVKDHGAVQVIDFASGEYKPIAGIIYIGFAASGPWLQGHKELAAKAVRAVARALRLMHDDPAAAKAAVRTFFPGTDAGTFDASWDSQAASFPATPRIQPQDVGVTAAFLAAMNGHPYRIDVPGVFTNDYVDLAERPR